MSQVVSRPGGQEPPARKGGQDWPPETPQLRETAEATNHHDGDVAGVRTYRGAGHRHRLQVGNFPTLTITTISERRTYVPTRSSR